MTVCRAVRPQQRLLNFLSILFVSNADKNEKKDKLYSDYGIIMTKKIEQEVEKMCNLSQGIKEQGIAEGIAIATKKAEETQTNKLLSYIHKTQVRTKMSLQDIMDMLELSKEERQVVIQRYKEGK